MKKSNGYTINHAGKTIIITKDFDKRSCTIDSNEYRTLVQLHKSYPDYEIKKRTAAKSAKKTTHRGLTIDFMGNYLAEQDNAEVALNEFEAMKRRYLGHPAYYAKVKAWFLKKHPDYNDYDLAA